MTTPRNHFEAFLDGVRREGRYRIFTDLERHADRPPYATWRGEGIAREVVVWCSNDYLGMGRHPAVVNAMLETALRNGAGAGGTATSPAIATRWLPPLNALYGRGHVERLSTLYPGDISPAAARPIDLPRRQHPGDLSAHDASAYHPAGRLWPDK
jgi:hypothetical protein